jgi:organic hydroperoxide reductase OsmC/OhrA
MARSTPKVFEFDVSVARDGTASSGRGGDPIPLSDEWWSEHLVLTALVRCTLASLGYYAHRAGLEVAGSGGARGTVTRREDDGLYALVDVEATLDVEVTPAPEPTAVKKLVADAERGCFVGNSLAAKPRYSWTVNGVEVA